jgi:hypothetical protein
VVLNGIFHFFSNPEAKAVLPFPAFILRDGYLPLNSSYYSSSNTISYQCISNRLFSGKMSYE